MKKILLFITVCFFCLTQMSVLANTIQVINTNDSGSGSLRDAINNANSTDTITFDPSLIAGGSATITLNSEISWSDKGLTVKGLYNATDTLFISGNNTNRIFSLDLENAPTIERYLTIDSLVLINGFGTMFGGAISIEDGVSLNVLNCIIRDNTVSNSSITYGGGIYLYDNSTSSSDLTINVINSTIKNNTSSSSSQAYGGGIYTRSLNHNTFINIENSSITGNISSGDDFSFGGGFIGESIAIIINITNSVINNNAASNPNASLGSGGGLYFRAINSSIVTNINNSSIVGNSASSSTNSDGGGIYTSGNNRSTINFNNSTISGNSSSASTNAYGGGIYSMVSFGDSSNINVINTTISGNSSSASLIATGGGIYSFGSSYNSNINITNSTISGNNLSANNATDGGGIYSSGSNESSLKIVNSTINGNSFSGSGIKNGEGIYINGDFITTIEVISSIIWNGTTTNIYQNAGFGITTFTSNGFNIFSDAPAGTIASDLTNVSGVNLNLQPIANNGGNTKTVLPGAGSVAIDAGNPNDQTYAQNKPLLGIRDIGAAEVNCNGFAFYDETRIESYAWTISGDTYTNDTIVFDTLSTPSNNGCDSIAVLNLTIIIPTFPLNSEISAIDTVICNNSSTTINQSNSNTGFNYYLRNDLNDTIVDGPYAGTGTGISFNTGNLSTTTTYNIIGGELIQADTALQFNFWNHHVNLGNSLNSTLEGINTFTVEAYVKSTTTSGLGTIIGNYNTTAPGNMQFLLRRDGNAYTFWVDNGSGFVNVTTTASVQIDTWQHVAGTWDGNEIKIYLDGVLDNTVSLSGTNFKLGHSGDIWIGGNNSTTEGFSGEIDNVSLWSTAKNATQISNDMNTCFSGSEANLFAAYNLNDGNGSSTLTDVSPNVLDGTLTNMDVNTAWVSGSGTACTSPFLLDQEEFTNTVTVTISGDTTGTAVITACGSLTWIDGNTYTTDNNTAIHVLSNIHGCDSTVTLDLTINNNLPDVTTTQTGGVNLMANASGVSYQWIDCDNNNAHISGETNQNFVAIANGNYAVIVDNGDCIDTSACITVGSVGINNQGDFENISVYPNPTTGQVQVNIGSSIGQYDYKLVSIDGKVITDEKDQTESVLRLNLGDRAVGVYLFKIQTKQGNKTIRIVKN